VNVQEAFKSLFDFELRYFALIRSPIVPTSYSRIFVCIPRGSLHLLPVFFQSFFKKTGQPQIFADFAQFAAKFLICVSLTPLVRSCMITQRCLRLRHLEQSRRIGERLRATVLSRYAITAGASFRPSFRGFLLSQVRPLIPATR
jgi:hypothetical protein